VLASRATGELETLETALYSAGYLVVTAHTGTETIESVYVHQPDAVLLHQDLSGPGFELCHTLRAHPSLSAAAPILLTQDEAPTPAHRLNAFQAGAWDVEATPVDPQTLLARLGVYLEAKLEVDRLAAECLIDRGTGLYNSHGFTQRAAELAALTTRQGAPAACAVFRPTTDLPSRAAHERLGRAFRTVGRLSDAIGRTAPAEFAVFAPATNDWAAARLVRRMRDNVIQEVGYIAEQGQRVTLRAAYSAALASQKVEPEVLLQRARSALSLS
jgi:PleD family two-component response regulator